MSSRVTVRTGGPREEESRGAVVAIRSFGKLLDIVPADAWLQIAFPVSVEAVREAFVPAFPEIAAVPVRFAVDGTLVGDDSIVTAATEIALFPPFSGG
ncbi:MAG: MoaD/ThiS family protein [Spirochaeta sp.]|jgi:molybdopterin converting factor small subunit|nr:MoaD/ThiS family protein [Spirochaeta sp.]